MSGDASITVEDDSQSHSSTAALQALVADLRAQLALAQAQAQAQAQYNAAAATATTSSSSSPSAHAASAVPAPVRDRRTSIPRPPSRLASASATRSRGPDSPSIVVGYAGAPPSSLAAAPTAAPTAAVHAPMLRRDKSYDDLASQAGRGARTRKVSAGGGQLQHRKRSSSIGSSINTNGSATRASGASLKRPPVIARGSVGTATALAGGGSPKSPPMQRFASDQAAVENEGSLSPYDAQYALDPNRDYAHAEEDTVLELQSRSNSLPLPSLSPNLSDRERLGPRYSTESELSIDTPDSSTEAPPPPVAVTKERDTSGSSRLPRSSAPLRTGSSPFFGGSAGFTERHAARIASSQSGTSKVIMSLQTELTNSRAQLDVTRTQLRSSARAVESLTRQLEDSRESRERGRIELAGLSTTLARRERMLEETLARARAAEGAARALEEEKKAHGAECAKRVKELESRCREAEERRAKADAEYNALKAASGQLTDSWKKEVRELKREQAALRAANEQAISDARTRQAAVSKSLADRSAAHADAQAAMEDMARWRTALEKQYRSTLAGLAERAERAERENAQMLRRTQGVLDELAGYKRAMQAFADAGVEPSQASAA